LAIAICSAMARQRASTLVASARWRLASNMSIGPRARRAASQLLKGCRFRAATGRPQQGEARRWQSAGSWSWLAWPLSACEPLWRSAS
jgi:hypothetical protein